MTAATLPVVIDSLRLAVALAAARVVERVPLSRSKLPCVASRKQVELEDPVVRRPRGSRLLTVDLAVGFPRRTHRVVRARSPGADYELADAVGSVQGPVRALWDEALVVVGVPAQYYVGTLLVERIPERLHYVRIGGRRAEQRVVEGGRRARRGVCCEVCLKPLPLRRGSTAAAHLVAVAVQDHYVPAPPVIAVVALARIARLRSAEVVEVSGGARRLVLVVTYDRSREGPHIRVHYLKGDVRAL